MTNIKLGDRIFFTHRNDWGHKTRASGLVVEISRPMGENGPEHFRVSCDTPDVWIGTRDPQSNTCIVDVPERQIWRLK